MKIEIRGRRGIDLSGLTIKMTVKVKRFFRWVEETYVFEANNGKESSGDIGLGYYRLCLASKKPISRKARKMIVKRDQDKRIEVSFKGEKAIFTLNAA